MIGIGPIFLKLIKTKHYCAVIRNTEREGDTCKDLIDIRGGRYGAR